MILSKAEEGNFLRFFLLKKVKFFETLVFNRVDKILLKFFLIIKSC